MEELWIDAEAQHGAFGRWQATERDVSAKVLRGWVRRGEIDAVTDRVFRVRGAPRTPEQDLMIAVLDVGRGGAASLRASGWLWRLPAFVPKWHDVVRVRNGSRWPTAGSGHWPRLLPVDHITVVRGIPCTTLPRTIFDLAGRPEFVRRMPRLIDTIHGRSPSILHALHALLPVMAKRGRPGITLMRELLAERPPGAVRLTGLERRFEEILRNAGMKVPRQQIDLGGHSWIGRVDYYDDDIKVIYEIDSEAHHTSLTDIRNDERRDQAAREAGFREVVRIPEEHIWHDPPKVVAAVRDARARYGPVSS